MLSKHEKFTAAVPVWAEGRHREMNLSLVFILKAGFRRGKKYELALTASSVYMAFCGDDFLGVQNYTRSQYGPEGMVPCPEGAALTQMDYEIYPEALEHVIRRVHAAAKRVLH